MISISELKDKCLNGELTTGIFASVNEDDEKVVVQIYSKECFQIQTLQSNGWVRVNDYNYDSESGCWDSSESFEGKWK